MFDEPHRRSKAADRLYCLTSIKMRFPAFYSLSADFIDFTTIYKLNQQHKQLCESLTVI